MVQKKDVTETLVLLRPLVILYSTSELVQLKLNIET